MKTNLDKVILDNCHFFYNDKILLLTTLKISHSWCREKFKVEKDIGTSVSLNMNDFTLHKHESESNEKTLEYHQNIDKIWKNFLDNKEKRDFVILYRNPIEQFISAFMQDYTSIDDRIKNNALFQSLFISYVNNLNFSETDKNNFINNFFLRGITQDLFTKFPKITRKIIDFLFYFRIKYKKYDDSHYQPWITPVVNLYFTNIIDKNKFKFIDIYENDLELELSPYFEKTNEKSEAIRKHKYIFDYVKSLIEDNKDYHSEVKSYLKYEILNYNMLKNKKL